MRELIEGRYALDELLGRGGFGEVWRAWDDRVGRWVAVKVGYPETVQDARRFEREANLAGNLGHPNIATVHDFGRGTRAGRDMVFLVMELLQGDSLAAVVARGLPPLSDVLDWSAQIAAALGAAHDAGVVHRDIKPANVMITETRVVKVLDFGIAKSQGTPMTELTATGMIIGSFPYMAPERWTGGADGAPVDGRADLYALGCVITELLTGRPPFNGGEVYELLAQHLQVAPAPPSGLRAGLPAALDRLVLDLLAKDPRQRPAHAAEVARRLVEIARGTGEDQDRRPAGPAPHVANSHLPEPGNRTPTERDAGAAGYRMAPTAPLTHVVEAEDPVRLMLRRRLTELLEDRPADLAERLGALIGSLTEELGADDALTMRAVYHRALAVRHLSRAELERVLPRMMRVLGVEHPDTITARAVYVGEAAAGPGDGRRHEEELREIIEQATRVLGPLATVTLTARYHLAAALYRGSGARDEPRDQRTPEQAARQAALLAPLLPDLEQGLPPDSPVLADVRGRLIHDSWLTGEFTTAARIYRQLYPDLQGLAYEGDAELAYRVARSIGEAGDPELAMTMIKPLWDRLHLTFGSAATLTRQVTEARSRFRQSLREQRRTQGTRPWPFGPR
ncbi:serine/threonine-protein kinase [Streptomyces sp. NPDC048664]|uniref:serine/threonine-protein kinase n=1 Tax=Streptomyces sp. NPDC048664 TaxID=3154505 RepID=UPI00343D3A20